MDAVSDSLCVEGSDAEQCRERVYRRNFSVFFGDYVLSMIGFNLLGPTTTIPDFVRQLTHSDILIGFSSQMFEVGFLVPQLLVARRLLRATHKKWWFVGPNIPVRTLILIFAGIILLAGIEHKTTILVLFLAFYGVAALGDGITGVAWLDLTGSSLDRKRRARLFGYGKATVGVAMFGLAPLVQIILGGTRFDFPQNYGVLFALAGCCFLMTVPIIMSLREIPGSSMHMVTPPFRVYLPQLWHIVKVDHPYRTMIITRVLAAFFALAGPFYIGFATERLGMPSSIAVSHMLAAQTLGTIASALVFSQWGERRNLRFIRMLLCAGILQPIFALLAGIAGRQFMYAAFLAGGIVIGSLTVSFLNWVVGYALPDQRPAYVGLFNTVSAFGLLIAPITGGVIVATLGYEAVFVAAMVMMTSALFVALRCSDTPD